MTNNGALQSLSNCPLFTGLVEKELSIIEEVGRSVFFQAGALIFQIGDTAESIFFVQNGTVSLALPIKIREETKDITIDEKETGAVIAWSALVPPYRFTFNARAATDVHMMGFERRRLKQVFEQNPRIHLVVFENLCRVIGNRVSLLEACFLRDLQRWVSDVAS